MAVVVAQYDELFERAHAAGHAAAEATTPSMPCGFAWVNVTPGTSGFARWLKLHHDAQKWSSTTGVNLWVHGYGQSYEQKYAYAAAFAGVLREAGISAIPCGRLD